MNGEAKPTREEEMRRLRERLGECLLRDARSVAARIRRLEAGEGDLRSVREALERAERRARERRRGAPEARLDAGLPIAAKAEEIGAAIRDRQVVVVCGETGSGKSTQLPLICLRAGRGLRGVIGHTQPRRIAARTIAARVADELGVQVGKEVGFKVRFDDVTDPGTYVKVMTDGVLLAELQSDRKLLGYDTIIIDEAHERSLNIDFLLGCLKRLLPQRPELRVVITSATIDPKRFSEHFGGAPVIEVSGRTYPVEVRYRDPAEREAADGDGDGMAALVDGVAEVTEHGPGDVLVFLPGEREIREAQEALQASGAAEIRGAEVLPLYARLSAKDQLRAFQPHERRRIVLATNIAETSVTVPGVHYVVDTGVARISRYHARSRVQGLDVEPVSQASANQRAGRCGRVAEGVCVRLYGREDFEQRPAFTDPEILRSNLAGVVLRMKALRLGDPRAFPFLDRPSPRRIRDAYDTLHELGAIDAEGELTAQGRALAAIPVDPRLGRMLLTAASEGALREVLVVVSCLSTRDLRERPLAAREEADRAHAALAHESSDILTLLNIWREARRQQKDLSVRQFRKWCVRSFLSWRGLREWEDMHRQLRRIARDRGLGRNERPASEDAVHRAVLSGMLSNVGKRGERYEYQGTLGTEFYIHPGSVCFERKPRWVVAAEMARTERVYARMVAPVRPEWIAEFGAHLLERTHSPPTWDHRGAAATVVERVSLLGLPLPTKRRIPYGSINPVHAREIFIRQGLVEGAYRPRADFVDHNDRVIRDVRRLEAKARRDDHESEAGARFDFYDRRIPGHVWSGKRFDRWRHKAEARDPWALRMRPEDLIVWAEEAPEPASYPDEVEIAGSPRPLEYRHDPGRPDDGVEITLPLAAFHELTEARHDWLVPGLVGERARAMLRALPKPIRRGIGPAPQVVEEYLAGEPSRERPLAETLAEFVGRTRGVGVSAADLRIAEVPPHLVPRIVVVDDAGAELAKGRDVAELRREVAGEVEGALREGRSALEQVEGVRSWEFGELPESAAVSAAGGEVTAHPAVVDRETSVALRLLPEAAAAREAHRRGVRRLLAIRHRGQLRRTLRDWPAMGAMRLTYASLGIDSSLDDEIGLMAIDRVVGAACADCRGQEAFERLSERLEDGLDGALLEAMELAGEVLRRAGELLRLLEQQHPPAWRDSIEDLREQLEALLPERPFSGRGWDRVRHLPRYLRGAVVRLQRLGAGGLERDVARMRELGPRWARWAELEAVTRELSPVSDVRRRLEAYGWMLQEYRVSLFAQDLGTAERVSPKRLDERWREVREALREDADAASLYAARSGA